MVRGTKIPSTHLGITLGFPRKTGMYTLNRVCFKLVLTLPIITHTAFTSFVMFVKSEFYTKHVNPH